MAIVSANDLVIEREIVSFDNGGQTTDLLVNGLGLPHILLLAKRHGPYLQERYADLLAGDGEDLDTEQVILELLTEVGPLAMDIIACAIGVPKRPDVAELLPMSVQIQILAITLRLTLAAEGGVGKLVESLAMLRATLDTSLGSLTP